MYSIFIWTNGNVLDVPQCFWSAVAKKDTLYVPLVGIANLLGSASGTLGAQGADVNGDASFNEINKILVPKGSEVDRTNRCPHHTRGPLHSTIICTSTTINKLGHLQK